METKHISIILLLQVTTIKAELYKGKGLDDINHKGL